MKATRKLLSVAFATLTLGIANAELPEQELSFTAGTGTTWNVDWVGIPIRTYFVQWSLDLVTWSYAPVVDYGTGPLSYGIDTGGVNKFFIRLKWTDTPTDDPELADFDGDGISNIAEINGGTDPFTFIDSDGDGLADTWEMIHFGNLAQDAIGDGDNDGFKNLDEFRYQLDPASNDATNTSGKRNFSYSLNRLTGVTSSVGAALAITYDGNSNITGVSQP